MILATDYADYTDYLPSANKNNPCKSGKSVASFPCQRQGYLIPFVIFHR